ncbi:MAG: hypothetical protein RIR62_2510 [Pseudomonadota bacterium]
MPESGPAVKPRGRQKKGGPGLNGPDGPPDRLT